MSRIVSFIVAVCLWLTGAAAQDAAGLARFVDGQIEDRRFGGTHMTLTLSQGVPWRLFTLTDPWRLVLDFSEVDWQGADPTELNQSDRVPDLRIGLFRPGWSRLVMELSEPMAIDSAELETGIDGAAATLRLQLTRSDPDRFAALAGLPADPDWVQMRSTVRKPEPAEDAPMVIVLDPGHGGIDPGAQSEGIKEADLVLQFARELREMLLRAGDYRVLLTREEDHFVSLEGRVKYAHDVGADLFISLHADALQTGVAHGAAVYTLAEEASDAASAALAERHDRDDLLAGLDLSGTDDRVAQILLDLARLDNTPRGQALAGHLVEGIRSSLGHVHKDPLRQGAFSVLKSADVPSVLIELGFLSSVQDLRNLQDPAWRAGMAAGIGNGIAQWALEDEALSRLRRQ
jgi:N-acetylmuramoyl-L-alanine amidase